MDVTEYAFRREALKDRHMFRIPESRFGEVLVSEAFAGTVEEHGLKGLRLLEVWSG